jgi:hypothetical protein
MAISPICGYVDIVCSRVWGGKRLHETGLDPRLDGWSAKESEKYIFMAVSPENHEGCGRAEISET